LHPVVGNVITVAMRRWRKSWWASRHEIRSVCRDLKTRHYDLALDTQGLIKSALVTHCTHTDRCGYASDSAREPLASWLYDRTFSIAKDLHAVERNRRLAAAVLGYSVSGAPDYGIRIPDITLSWLPDSPYVVLLHATSRDDKLWDEQNWIALGRHLQQAGLVAVLPWGSEQERSRSERLAAAIPGALCPPRLKLDEATVLLGKARAAVGVDTGLSHLAAALDIPTIGIYTATDPGLTGLYAGARAVNLGGKDKPPSVDAVIVKLRELGAYI
jgi:heptosyltransferase-1